YLGGSRMSGRAPEGSFERWVDDKFGRPLNDYFFKPYTEKLWGIPASRLSDDWAAQRISLLNVKDALLKSLPFAGKTPRTYAKTYYYPKGGIGAIFETMASDIKRLGGTILTGMEPVGLETEGNRVSRIIIGKNGKGHSSIASDKLLSTIPLDSVANLVEPGISAQISFRSLRFLNIMLDSKEFSENTWMYVPEPEFIMSRIQEPKRRSPFSAPEGKTSVMLEIPCEYGDDVWSMSDDGLLETVLANLKALGFDIEREVKGCFSTRARHAYPRYEMGYLEKVKRLRKTVERFINLSTLGRQGLFRYIFMDTAMIMGREWATNILGKRGTERIDEICNSKELIETQSVVA
ncbi:MAG: UDP-galactopyranose mutase, partial [Candidatus Desulfatibia sp.]|uniref:UDP-galactopyranose mutase n=1 Tax=Candidatus Desulfatibia sp. TaxID=3101189 RepID=UPI002F2F9B2D